VLLNRGPAPLRSSHGDKQRHRRGRIPFAVRRTAIDSEAVEDLTIFALTGSTRQSGALLSQSPGQESDNLPGLQIADDNPHHRMSCDFHRTQLAESRLIANPQFLQEVLPLKVQLAPRDGN
jgi:hypothetical protein